MWPAALASSWSRQAVERRPSNVRRRHLWDLTENPISKDGILRAFRGAVLIFCRLEDPFSLHGTAKPVVSFSLDPRRLVTKKLVREKDEPIYLDRKRTLGESVCFQHMEFDAVEFPWDEALNLPKPG
jgi:hypothetical protein